MPYAISSLSSGSSGANATRALDNLQNVAVNTAILPAADGTIDFGSVSNRWKDVLISGSLSDGTKTTTVANIATLDGTQALTNKTIDPASNPLTLANGNILIGNASGRAVANAVSGAITISNTGVAAIQPNSVTLGTDTVGNYVGTVAAAASGATTVTGVAGEGTAATVGVRVDNSGIEINGSNNLQLKDGGVTSAKIADGTIVNADIADATIQNAKLVNNSVTVTPGAGLKNGGSVALGSSVTVDVDNGDGIQIAANKVAVDATVVRTAGDQSVAGVKTFSAIPVLPGSNPVSANDAVRKAYVDNLVNGLSWKNAVRAASAGADLTLSGTQTVDGVALVAGDRILVKNQSTASQNGIYVVGAGAWTRALDMDTAAEVKGAAVFVTDGTANQGKAWACNNSGAVVLDTTSIVFVQFASPGVYTAGSGLTLTGLEFAVDVDNSTIGFTGNKLQLKAGGITSAQIANNTITTAQIAANAIVLGTQTTGNYVATVAGNSIITATGTGAGAAVTLDLANASVTSAKIANGTIVDANISATAAIADTKLAQITTADKVAGSAVQLNAAGGLENSTGLQVKLATGSGLTAGAGGVRITVCNKTDATVAPTINNDVNDSAAPNGIGYAVGSVWVDTVAQKQYVCVKSTDGAAVWSLLNPLATVSQSNTSYSNRSTSPWLSK